MSETPDDSDGPDALDERPEAVSTAVSSNYKVLGETDAPDGTGVLGHNLATSGVSYGVEAVTESADTESAGLYGLATQESGDTYGVRGVTQSAANGAHAVFGQAPHGDADGVVGIANQGGFGVGGLTTVPTYPGVKAVNTSKTGSANGLLALTESSGDGSSGVVGEAIQSSGQTYGVTGITPTTATGAAGVLGRAIASGATTQVHGIKGVTDANADSTNAVFPSGVRGEATGSGGVVGVHGLNTDPDGIGVAGAGFQGRGVVGRAFAGVDDTKGVEGWASAGSGRTYGIHGRTDSVEDASAGVRGRATATTGTAYGVEGHTDSAQDGAAGVRGVGAATSGGVYGTLGFTESPSGVGVVGSVADSTPLISVQGAPTGVWGHTDKSGADADVQYATGVYGGSEATSGETYGVTGSTYSPDGYAVYGTSRDAGGYAVYADGDSKTDGDHEVTGSQTVGELGASVFLANDQTIDSGSSSIVEFDSEEADDRDEFDTSTGTFTAADDGAYHVCLQIAWFGGLPADTTHRLTILVNGSNHTDRSFNVPDSSTNFVVPFLSRTLRLDQGDDVEVEVFQNSGSSQDLSGTNRQTWMTIDNIG